ncbi:MAG: mandelate racemase/muconate lactonizing enzyme family protein [Peptococcaceae bacterium]
MKITKIDIMLLHPRNQKGESPKSAFVTPQFSPVVCRIYTDEGIFGDGEAALSFNCCATSAIYMIKDMAELIIGFNPLENEVIWDRMYRQSFWALNGGCVTSAAISAIDNAIWDIRGKVFNVPVHTLLGGKKRNELRCYASQIQFGWGNEPNPAKKTADFVQNALRAVEAGYDAVKANFFVLDEQGNSFTDEHRTGFVTPKFLNMVEERIAAVREAIGNDVDLIVENHGFTDSQSVVKVSKRIEKYNILFIEEPSTPSADITKYIADNISIPLAGGERIYTRQQYKPYLDNGSLRLIQPDLGTSGGITEVKKICDYAYTCDVSVQLHVCGSPIAVAASLQLEAVIPNFTIHEDLIFNHFAEYKELCIYEYGVKEGKITIPDRPGIGNELSEYALKTCDKITVK